MSVLGILKAKGLALNLGTHALPLPAMRLAERIAEDEMEAARGVTAYLRTSKVSESRV
jgi:hypothetical protein